MPSMSSKGLTAGIIIDTWKLAIFRRKLDDEEFIYTENKGEVEGTILLAVALSSDEAEFHLLSDVVREAMIECEQEKLKASVAVKH